VKMGPTRCPETSVNNYHTTPRNIPEERRSQYDGSLGVDYSQFYAEQRPVVAFLESGNNTSACIRYGECFA
jgi:hypothetical protein